MIGLSQARRRHVNTCIYMMTAMKLTNPDRWNVVACIHVLHGVIYLVLIMKVMQIYFIAADIGRDAFVWQTRCSMDNTLFHVGQAIPI